MKDHPAVPSRRGAAIELCFVALITRDGGKCSRGEGGTGAVDERGLGLGRPKAEIALIGFIGNEGGSWQFTPDGGCGGSEGEEKEWLWRRGWLDLGLSNERLGEEMGSY